MAFGILLGFLLGMAAWAGNKSDEVPIVSTTSIEASTGSIVIPSTPIPESTNTESTEPTEKLVSLGEYKLTAYCPCEICCGVWGKDRPTDADGNLLVLTASGAYAEAGVTIAADTSVLPFGTVVLIDGHEYIVQDRGSAVKGNQIDIYFENHQDAVDFGVQYKEIFIIERVEEND